MKLFVGSNSQTIKSYSNNGYKHKESTNEMDEPEGKTNTSITTEMPAWRSFDNYNTTP